MPRPWLPILCVAVLAAGCGSSSGSDEASSDHTATATATATATPTVHSADLQRLPQAPEPSGRPLSPQGRSRNAFLRESFDDIETLWHREFSEAELTYHPARLTIFTQQVHTACGSHGADVGPFYCPASFGVYLDPAFFAALSRKTGVRLRGFAQAYVVAHEVGHHVQTLLGVGQQMAAANHQDPSRANQRSVRFELQADCLAGVWMHSVYGRGELTDADLEQALSAAAVVGDDFLAHAGQSRPPEEWTHGSSAQRQQWLKTGFAEGKPDACDTFNH